ncbi:hypothetical protein AB670_02530 [Chryseobacterium sp. MOF25P]|nr:hypothetical protein AB670_02530 [Chryseobacterium sp. MOF25P]OBW45790.1 hypothetical protein AB671_02199 [Chryseobacterium sp. BGARF1]
MCTKNENRTENIVKLTKDEFFTQLEKLLKSAPENMLYLVNAMEDSENNKDKKDENRQVIALSGSCHKLCYAFKNGFDQDHRFEHVVSHAVDYSRLMKSLNPSLFNVMTDFNRTDHLKSLLDRLFGQ